MMKKSLVALMLVLCLLFTAVPAFAAGKLNVLQENFHVLTRYSSTYGYAYAKVENSGDRPIKVNACILEIFDENGDVLTSTDSFSSYARYLQPGEYTYVNASDECEDVGTKDVDDYMLTITGKNEKAYVSKRLPCTTDYKENVAISKYNNYDYLYATVTNNTDEVVYDLTFMLALLDAEGNILYVSSTSMGSSQAICPNSSVEVRLSVPDYFEEYFALNGYTPASVDAIAYVNVAVTE